MSRIFEALQRSEAERSGNELLIPPESVADLLQLSDRDTRGTRETPQETEGLTGSLVLRPSPQPDSRLVCLVDQGSLGAEKFRLLGLRLRNVKEKRKLKKVVVTSTMPEEGKSLVAANLALNQARSKVLKTVLVDGDLRRPTQATRFGVGELLPGLSECLQGERKLRDVVYRLEPSGLWFLPAGAPIDNPMELMQSGKLVELLDELSASFDWVIIDSPPLLPLADAAMWMKLSDGLLLVIREGLVQSKPLKRAIEMLDKNSVLGIVVNSCSTGDNKDYYRRYSQSNAKAIDTLTSNSNEI